MTAIKRPLLFIFTLCAVIICLDADSNAKERKAKPTKWRNLFDGKTLDGWETVSYTHLTLPTNREV